MRRREFISVLGTTALWPMVARAKEGLPVIGYLSPRSASEEAPLRDPFLKTLEANGFVVGRNISIEYRFTDGRVREDQWRELASELVQQQVVMLVTTDRASALAAKAATSAIPIIFGIGDDPVKLGLVASLNKPGGNATGVYVFTSRLGAKRLGLIRELLPDSGLIALLVNPDSTSTPVQIEEMQQAASAVGQPLLVFRAGSEREVEEAFTGMAQQKVRAALLGASPYYQVINDRLVGLAARHRIPVFYEWRELVVAGGLMSYNANRTEAGREIGRYAAQILKGSKAADLPAI